MDGRRNACSGWLWGALWLLLGLAACRPVPLSPTPTPSPAPPTATPTSTSVPFPPTRTPTPLPPTLPPLPTPDPFAGRGPLLLDDPFTDAAPWTTPRFAVGTLTVHAGRLTLEVGQPPGLAAALRREPTVRDFILTTRVAPRLCRGRDAYGLLLRADAAGRAFYRLGVTCAGEVLAEYVEGQVVVPLSAPQRLPLPTTFPVEVPLAVWARGSVVRFYVHGILTLELNYPNGRRSGLVGAFARAVGETPVAVDFLSWQVWAQEGSP